MHGHVNVKKNCPDEFNKFVVLDDSRRTTVLRRITTFRSTTDRIYDGGLKIILAIVLHCLQYSVQ
jgi:hypothetical protein